MQTLQMPAMPDPARVTLNPKTTALIVLDYVEDICAAQPICKSQMLPAMIPFLQRVREAGLVVAYGTRAQNMAHWLKEVAPVEGDLKIVSTAQDRFHNTDLDKLLKAKGITTLIMVGDAIGARQNRSRLYDQSHAHIFRRRARAKKNPAP